MDFIKTVRDTGIYKSGSKYYLVETSISESCSENDMMVTEELAYCACDTLRAAIDIAE